MMVATAKGFTLSEVLMAIVVLSVGLLALARMQIAATQVNTIANRLTQAITLAQDKVERFTALPYDDATLADITPVGTFTHYADPQTVQGYTVSWDVDTNAPSVGSKMINIMVTWKNKAGQPKEFHLSMQKAVL